MAGCNLPSTRGSAGNGSPGGHLYGARARRRAHLARSGASPLRAAHLQALRRERRQGDELARVRLRHAGLLGRDAGAHLRHRAPAGCGCPGTRSIWPTWGPDLAWNTAASFTTNTNWQFYTPESTMSYLTEMVGLATHNFWSAAAGIVRGHRADPRHQAHHLGRRSATSGWI